MSKEWKPPRLDMADTPRETVARWLGDNGLHMERSELEGAVYIMEDGAQACRIAGVDFDSCRTVQQIIELIKKETNL